MPALYESELKKVLVYHWQSKLMGPALEEIFVLQSIRDITIESSDQHIGFGTISQNLLPFTSFPLPLSEPYYRVAASMAMMSFNESRGDSDEINGFSFSSLNAALPGSRRNWLDRSRILSRFSIAAVLLFVLTVTSLFISAKALSFFISSDREKFADDISKLEEVRRKKDETAGNIMKVSRVLRERSAVSGDMQLIASSLPDELWLSEWEVSRAEGRSYDHGLSGYCFSESRVSTFLSNLEKTGSFASVRLKSTELVKGDIVRRKTGLKANYRDLIHFRLAVSQ
jgi:Tfp pilus assembly protein PilN